jgi:hypothetical protein
MMMRSSSWCVDGSPVRDGRGAALSINCNLGNTAAKSAVRRTKSGNGSVPAACYDYLLRLRRQSPLPLSVSREDGWSLIQEYIQKMSNQELCSELTTRMDWAARLCR